MNKIQLAKGLLEEKKREWENTTDDLDYIQTTLENLNNTDSAPSIDVEIDRLKKKKIEIEEALKNYQQTAKAYELEKKQIESNFESIITNLEHLELQYYELQKKIVNLDNNVEDILCERDFIYECIEDCFAEILEEDDTQTIKSND